MQSFVLWAIYIAVFVIVFALIAIATRSILGVAWGFLIAAVLALIVTGIVAGCACYDDGDFFRSSGMTCLGGIAFLLIIVGIILVIAAYIYRAYQKKKRCPKPVCEDEENINNDMSCHPSLEEESCEQSYHMKPDRYEQKSRQKSNIKCDSDRGCVQSGSSTVEQRIRYHNKSIV